MNLNISTPLKLTALCFVLLNAAIIWLVAPWLGLGSHDDFFIYRAFSISRSEMFKSTILLMAFVAWLLWLELHRSNFRGIPSNYDKLTNFLKVIHLSLVNITNTRVYLFSAFAVIYLFVLASMPNYTSLGDFPPYFLIAQDPEFAPFIQQVSGEVLLNSPTQILDFARLLVSWGFDIESYNHHHIAKISIQAATVLAFMISAFIISQKMGTHPILSLCSAATLVWAFPNSETNVGSLSFFLKVSSFSFLSISLSLLALALAIRGNFKIGSICAALIVYLHPLNGLISLGVIVVLAGFNLIIDRRIHLQNYRSVFFTMAVIVAILLPAIMSASGQLVSELSDAENQVFFNFLTSRTSNYQPLRDGLMVVIGILVQFWATDRLLGLYSKSSHVHRQLRLFLWLIILAYIAQIIFSDVMHHQRLTSLALSFRLLPVSSFIFIIALFSALSKIQARSELGIWLPVFILAFLPLPVPSLINLFFPESPLLGYTNSTYSVALWTVAIVGAIQLGLKNEKSPVKLWGPLIIALIVLIFALAVTLYTVSDLMCNGGQVIQGCFKNGSLENRSKEIIPIVYFLAVFVIWIGCRQSVFLSSRSTLIFSPNKILIWSIIALTVFMPVKFSFQPDAKEIKRKEAIKQFVSVVPKGETVYSGLESSLLRLKRRQFMDWKYEATMTYYPKAIQNFDKRARSMGLNLVEEAPGDYICEPWRWLVIRRCGKRFFVIEDANDWRGRLPEMRKVVPTLTKALIRTSEVQGEDILSSYGKYSIISLP